MTLAYDARGRFSASSDDTGTTEVAYETSVPNRVASHSRTMGTATQRTAYGYDGPLVTSMAATGPAAGTYAFTYTADFRRTGSTLTVGATTVATPLEVDRDGAIAKDGPFTIERAAFAAAPTRISDGTGATSYGYDSEGRLTGRALAVGPTTWSSALTWDPAGRITGETEATGPASATTGYTYDDDDQLVEVRRDGAVVSSYAWDVDGRRTSGAATYDPLGQLTSLGGTARTSTADGALAARGADTFAYGPQGQLVSATVGGTTVTYGYDAANLRTSRTEGGQTTGYLYGDRAFPDRITAIVGPDGAVTTYTYDDFGHLVSFARGANRWYVGTDQVGTPRIVLDATGAVAEQRRADAFGVPLSTSGPGAGLPFGFAGGLADPVTGLVRFGTRDYDPDAGRFTTPDPILLASGTPDLFTWMSGDPVSGRDFDGRGVLSQVGRLVDSTRQQLVDGARKVVSIVKQAVKGQPPTKTDNYVKQVKETRKEAKKNMKKVVDPVTEKWMICATALAGGGPETGEPPKKDPAPPPKKGPGMKDFDTGQVIQRGPPPQDLGAY